MGSLLGQILAAMGAVLAALIAGAFAFFSLVAAKETKVSEFRQAWIDSLRAEIATYISRLHAVNNLGKYIHENPVEDKYNPELLRERSRMFEESLSAYNSIILRVNPEEKMEEARRLNESFLAALRRAQSHYEAGQVEVLEDSLRLVASTAAPLLKYEWNRVRRGEPAYERAKHTALGIAVAAGLGALLLLAVAIVYVPQYNDGTTGPKSAQSKEASGATPSAAVTQPASSQREARPAGGVSK